MNFIARRQNEQDAKTTLKIQRILEHQIEHEISLKLIEINEIKHQINACKPHLISHGLTFKVNDRYYSLEQCPDCSKENFHTIQGFINHCRIIHNIVYPSHYHAVIQCGKIVNPMVTTNIPVLVAPLDSGFASVFHSIVPFRSEIKVFDQDIDFDCPEPLIYTHEILEPDESTLEIDNDVEMDTVPETSISNVEAETRFYITRRIVVGNVVLSNSPVHQKWMIYIKPVDNDISYISKVRFFLHHSFKPYDVVDVTEEPFHLTRVGGEEVPVRLQISFCDSRNKDISIVHFLQVSETNLV